MLKGIRKRLSELDWPALVGSALFLFFAFSTIVPSTLAVGHPHHQASGQSANDSPKESVQDASAEVVAYYTKVLAWFTAVLAVVSTIQGFFLYRADRTARTAADAGRRAAEAAITGYRPWIKIGTVRITDALQQDGRGACLQLMIQLENVGNTPATNLQTWCSMALGGASFAEAAAKIPAHQELVGTSLFPKVELPDKVLWGRVVQSEIDEAESVPFIQGRYIQVSVFVSVTYDFAGGRGKTTKAFGLIGPGSSALAMAVNFEDLPLPPAELRLLQVPIHDVAS